MVQWIASPMTKKAPPRKDLTLEESLSRLDEIARRIEAEDVELSESLALFEEGVALLGVAHAQLDRATERVQQLIEQSDGFAFEDLEERT